MLDEGAELPQKYDSRKPPKKHSALHIFKTKKKSCIEFAANRHTVPDDVDEQARFLDDCSDRLNDRNAVTDSSRMERRVMPEDVVRFESCLQMWRDCTNVM